MDPTDRRRRHGAIGAGLGVWWLARNDATVLDALDCSTLDAANAAEASTLSVACGEQIEVLGERTRWQTSWVLPNGTSQLEVSTVPVRTEVDGAWVDIDPEMVVEDDAVRVAAPAFPITLNLGGEEGADQPLATIEKDDHVFEMWFPLELAEAALDESKVMYALGEGSSSIQMTRFRPLRLKVGWTEVVGPVRFFMPSALATVFRFSSGVRMISLISSGRISTCTGL